MPSRGGKERTPQPNASKVPKLRGDADSIPLTLSDLAFVVPLLRLNGRNLSETSFATLFLFRTVHRYVLIRGENPRILGRTYDGQAHIVPLFDPSTRSRAELSGMLPPGACFYPVAQEDVSAFGPDFAASWHDADSDYVYRSADMAKLSSPRAKARRAQAKRFAVNAMPYERDLDADTLRDAVAVLDRWLADVDKSWAETDYEACREALLHLEALELSGRVVYTTSEPVAFLVASHLAGGATAVHFAKASRAFDGAFPYMFSRFAGRAAGEFLNFEQDLGNPGLRQSKRSYGPCAMLRKFRLVPRF